MAGTCALGMGFEFPPGSRLRGWPCVWEALHKQGLLLPKGPTYYLCRAACPTPIYGKGPLGIGAGLGYCDLQLNGGAAALASQSLRDWGKEPPGRTS